MQRWVEQAGVGPHRDGVRAKLAVSDPGDAYEVEADRVADDVMRQSDADVAERSRDVEVRRNVEEDEVQAKHPDGERGGEVSGAIESAVRTSTGSGGRALTQAERGFFEPRIGADFSAVRVHTGQTAARAAMSIGARAFTVGNHIAMGASQYDFGSAAGKRLMAHELTHVVQNGEADRVRTKLPARVDASE